MREYSCALCGQRFACEAFPGSLIGPAYCYPCLKKLDDAGNVPLYMGAITGIQFEPKEQG